MIRLEKLTIRKLGNVAPNTELHFDKRGALLLGKNGTGKTTLLNIVVAVLRSDWQALTKLGRDGFELSYVLEVQLDTDERFYLNVVMKGDTPAPPLEHFIRFDSGGGIPPDYELTVTLFDSSRTELMHGHSRNNQTTLRTPNSDVQQRSSGSHSPANLLTFGDDHGRYAHDVTPFIGEHLTLRTEPLYRFDEAYSYYEHLTDDSDKARVLLSFYSLLSAESGAPPGFASPILSPGTARALRGALLLDEDYPDHLRLEVSPVAKAPPSWLLEFCKHGHLDKLSIDLELVSVQRSSSFIIAKYGPMSVRYSVHGTVLRGEQLSFGQKRLFSILHYFDANPDLVVADELVNGLHHGWIERCIDLIGDRQAFLSSQNPILFDFMYFKSAEEAAARFIDCSLDEQGRFVWRNMSADDAEEFYATYQVGVQHVSAILRTKGYW